MHRVTTFAVLLATSSGIAAQQLELPKTAARMDRVAEDAGAVAHLVVVVDDDGRRFVRAAGHADVGDDRPFEDWMLIPLGRLTRAVTLAGFDDACARGRLSPDAPIGDSVPGLGDRAAAVTWRALLGKDGGGFPGYLRYVPRDVEPRTLTAILSAHAFLPERETAWRESESMTPWALIQSALEEIHGAAWPEIVGRIAADALGMTGVRDARSSPEHTLVRRHQSDGTPTDRWLAEVAAADGAAVSGSDLARLLELALDAEHRTDVLADAREGISTAFEQTYRERHIAVLGASGTLRVYEDLRLAAFVFVARSADLGVRNLHETVLSDLLDPSEDLEEEFAVGLGGGVVDDDRTVVGRWKGSVRRLGETTEIELDVGLRRPARVRVGDGDFLTANGLKRWGTAVRGEFRSKRLAPAGFDQRSRLMVSFDGDALVGYAVLRAFDPELGEVERLPCPVRLERVGDR